MCPFGVTLCEYLRADYEHNHRTKLLEDAPVFRDVNPPMDEDEDEEKILKWKYEMERGEPSQAEQAATLTRMSLAMVTSSNALLGRPKHPRSMKVLAEEVDAYVEHLELDLSERRILYQPNAPIVHLRDLALPVQSMVAQISCYIAAFQKPVDVVTQLDLTQAASEFAWSFFFFAQKECGRRGSGIQGLIQACGIVIGRVQLEEVVFG